MIKKIGRHWKSAEAARTCPERRGLLKGLVGAAGVLAAPAALAALPALDVRQLALLNTHTGDRLEATYWEHGRYLPDALSEINYVLRDHRSGAVTDIEPGLLDLLHLLRSRLDARVPFHIISGYRSPETNAMLRRNGSGGVAKRSLHMQGKAVDVRVPGLELGHLRKVAMDARAGGVGYYPRSAFVHIDVGRVRYW